METAPICVPAPVMMEAPQRSKPVIIQPPEVSAAHDMAVIAFILTFLLSIPWLLLSLIVGGIGVTAYLGYVILPPVIPAIFNERSFLRPNPRIPGIRSFTIIPNVHRPRRRSFAHRPHLPRNPLLDDSSRHQCWAIPESTKRHTNFRSLIHTPNVLRPVRTLADLRRRYRYHPSLLPANGLCSTGRGRRKIRTCGDHG